MTSSKMKIKERMSLPNENSIQTDNGELHMALINYAITSSRLLFIQDLHVFADFHASDEAFNDLTTLELSAIFLGEILPNINSYPLTSRMKERLKLLDLNPCIRKTAQGYRYVPLDAAAQFALKPKCDFSMAEQFPELLSSQSDKGILSLKKPPPQPNSADPDKGASHTMLVDSETVAVSRPRFQLTHDIAVLCSSMISSDLELSSAQLHNVHEVHRRLRSAKQSFEDKGLFQPFRKNLEELTDNIDAFGKLRTKLSQILSRV